MISKNFQYIKPKTLKEASDILMTKRNSMILSGGTELIISLRNAKHCPDIIVDIKDIPLLKEIKWEKDRLFIGSTVSWSKIKNNSDILEYFPALSEASKVFGCFEIRNRATLGGNICNASPGCEAGGPCTIYEAQVKLYKQGKERVILIKDFITGPGHTCIEQGEILMGVYFPLLPKGSKSGYERVARVKGQDLATCAITMAVINPNLIKERVIRIALSSVMKVPYRGKELEDILSKKPIDKKVINKAKDWLKSNIYPRASSLRGTPYYKKEALVGMLEILLKRFEVY